MVVCCAEMGSIGNCVLKVINLGLWALQELHGAEVIHSVLVREGVGVYCGSVVGLRVCG